MPLNKCLLGNLFSSETHFIKTTMTHGLTENDANQAINLLNCDKSKFVKENLVYKPKKNIKENILRRNSSDFLKNL